MHENQLTGAIPAELGQLASLTVLGLHENQLTGVIPAELAKLANLTVLWLNGNHLTGSIPAELGKLIDLTDLRLSGNRLIGAIPPELGQLTSLARLWLNGNRLTGTIPAELGMLTNLTDLLLDKSQRDDDHDGEIAGMIAAGETRTVEFKEALRSVKGGGKPEQATLKSIAALLNTNGGHLLIGIRDNGEVCGIGDELEQFANEDEMLRYLTQIVEASIGDAGRSMVHPEFRTYRGVRILVIRCDQSPDPVFIEERRGPKRVKKVYVRTGPQAKELDDPEELLKHFSSRALKPSAT